MQPSQPCSSSHQEGTPFVFRNPVPKHFAGWVSFLGILFLAGGIFVLKNDYLSSVGGKVMIALGLLAILGETGINCCLSMAKWKKGSGAGEDGEREMGDCQLVTAASSASLAPAASPVELRGPSPTHGSSRNLVALLPPSPLIVRLEAPKRDDRAATEVKKPGGADRLSLKSCSSTTNIRASPTINVRASPTSDIRAASPTTNIRASSTTNVRASPSTNVRASPTTNVRASSTTNVRASQDEIPPSYEDVVKSAIQRTQL
ncbi:hypothetical protein Bbelb_348550 [Branchiostoma belcheri]|nr:hypothetical protein Bbelb_348550 [Branchiostoma belcheri]